MEQPTARLLAHWLGAKAGDIFASESSSYGTTCSPRRAKACEPVIAAIARTLVTPLLVGHLLLHVMSTTNGALDEAAPWQCAKEGHTLKMCRNPFVQLCEQVGGTSFKRIWIPIAMMVSMATNTPGKARGAAMGAWESHLEGV